MNFIVELRDENSKISVVKPMKNVVFYFLSSVLIFSLISVCLIKDLIYRVLGLITVFISSSCLFFLLNAAFLSMVVLILYVGAIAILFLFLVMMLHNRIEETEKKNWIKGGGICFLLLTLLIFVVSPSNQHFIHTLSLKKLGYVFYSDYSEIFFTLSALLLIITVGSVALAKDLPPPFLKQQKNQMQRQKDIKMAYPTPGEGVKVD